jgi:hypothetical protein
VEYLGWSEPEEETGAAEAERMFFIDLVDIFCDSWPMYEDFRFAYRACTQISYSCPAQHEYELNGYPDITP